MLCQRLMKRKQTEKETKKEGTRRDFWGIVKGHREPFVDIKKGLTTLWQDSARALSNLSSSTFSLRILSQKVLQVCLSYFQIWEGV